MSHNLIGISVFIAQGVYSQNDISGNKKGIVAKSAVNLGCYPKITECNIWCNFGEGVTCMGFLCEAMILKNKIELNQG